MPRKKKRPTPLTVGLDIGYGITKATSGSEPITFPSVWGRKGDVTYASTATQTLYTGDDLTDDDGEWWIGEKAQTHVATHKLRDLRSRTDDEARLRLAKAALGKLPLPAVDPGDTVHMTLATGLPVDHMRSASALKDLFTGQHVIQNDRVHYVANITRVYVMPQPYGTLYRQMLKPDGTLNRHYQFERTGIVDVGTYTIDMILDDDGEYVDARSGSVEAGVHTVYDAIETAYERDQNQKPSYKDVMQGVRTGAIRIRGDLVFFEEVHKKAVKDLAEATLGLAARIWEAGTDIDVIFLTGGGASLIAEAFKQKYPQSEIVEDAPTANAQGYRYFAAFSQKAAEAEGAL